MVEETEYDETAPLNAMVSGSYKVTKTPDQNVDTKFSPYLRQLLGSSGPIIATISSGMTAGYSAILLPQLESPDTDIEITRGESSWIASMAALPMALGCIASGFLMDKFGRKMTHIITCLPFIVGWCVIATANGVLGLYIGRFITGFCVGLLSPICQVFIAEISHPQYRGALLAAGSLSVSLGIMISHVLGTVMHWKLVAGLSAIPAVICIVLICFVPETPSYLFSRNEMKKGESAFRWYRGYSPEADSELQIILKKHSKVFNIAEYVQPEKESTKKNDLKKLLIKSSFLKPFVILNIFFFVQQFSGVNAVAFYCVTLLKSLVAGVNEYLATIIIDVVRLIMSFLAVILLRQNGRRVLTIISGIGTAISLISLAAYLAYFDVGAMSAPNNSSLVSNTTEEVPIVSNEVNYLSYFPLVSMISYIGFVSIGLVPLPWVLSGEIFSRDTRGLGSGICSSFGLICFFVVVKTSPDLMELLSRAGCFALYGIICTLGVAILYFCLPETKNKTLIEIEALFKNKKTKMAAIA